MTAGFEIRNVDLPAGAEQNLPQFLAKQQEPLTRGQVPICWRSSWLPSSKPTQPYHYIISSPQHAAELAKGLLGLGLECQTLECLPQVLAEAVQLAPRTAEGPTAIVDWAAESPTFVLVRGGQPFFSRRLRDCGFQVVLDSLAERMGLEPNELDQLLLRLSEHSEPSNVGQLVQRHTAGLIEPLLAELARTVEFLRVESRELVPTHLWLAGGGAGLPGLDEAATEATDIPAAVWQLRSTHHDAAHSSGKQLYQFASALALSAIPLTR
jgi:Tfp pilus assembly PilM family ATPase